MGVIVDDLVRGQKGVAERGAETHRTCSSDAKEGGLEFQSNRMSGWMSCTRARPSDAERQKVGGTHLMRHENGQRPHIRIYVLFHQPSLPVPPSPTAHLVSIPNQAMHHPALERLEHNRPVARQKLCLAAPTQYHPFPDVQDRHDRYDVPELTRAGALDVRVELRLEEYEHPRPKVRWVQQDGVR
ncbi:hypothetical protein H0H87_010014 [Tephrocybe sp. NHM501043]|nr:hypothetical protein H0H87_010014 [Tephrocybe sp. NHM501043]